MSEEPEGQKASPTRVLPDVYSRRKRESKLSADPLQYEEIPDKVRTQILHALDNAIKLDQETVNEAEDANYEFLVNFFREELGLFKLCSSYNVTAEFQTWFLSVDDVDQAVDAIELICRLIGFMAERSHFGKKTPDLKRIIRVINGRLMEAGVGFQYENGAIIKVSSKYNHAEIIMPALSLLAKTRYDAAEREFMTAHKAFRGGQFEQCLIECCKSFESVIKVIASERGWIVSPNATAKDLVNAVFANHLIPNFLESEFTGIRTVLESGVGTLRNKSGGHGAGVEVRVVPRRLAAFQLHQTAAAITLLADAHSDAD